MDILYYSNYCKHSQKILQFLSKGGLLDGINAYSIDKRSYDKTTNQLVVYLDNGENIYLPPNIQSVPALLLVNKNYQVVLGDEIIQHFEPAMKKKIANATLGNGEPSAFPIHAISGSGGSNIVSEQFTFFDMTPEELSSKGEGGQRQMYNYVPVNQENSYIQTPPDTYRPDKIGEGVTMDDLQQKRNAEISNSMKTPQFQYNTMNI